MPSPVSFFGQPQFGLVQTSVIGLVIDNVDPDDLARIRVKFPTLPDEPKSWWCRVASPNAGKERGFYALPEKDDEVLVMFLQGSQDVGLIVGQFWNGKDTVPVEAKDSSKTGKVWKGKKSKDVFKYGSSDTKKNDRRFWKSRSGHLFLFDDTSGKETVQIWDKKRELALVFDCASGRIILSNSKGDLHIRTAKDLYLEAGQHIYWQAAKNIEGKAGEEGKEEYGKNLAIKTGMSFQVEAKKDIEEKGLNFKIEGKAKGNIKANAGVTVESPAKVEVSGKTMVQVQGGMVNIN
jgi:uncharacterized protein involved in type VI secretion and phage assembly